MSHIPQSPLRRSRPSRERQAKRQQRRGSMVSLPSENNNLLERLGVDERLGSWRDHAWVVRIQDGLWYLMNRTRAPLWLAGGVGVGVVLFVMSLLFSNQIGANVWAMDTPLSGLTVDEAQARLLTLWREEKRIDVVVEGEVLMQISPVQLGLNLNAREMAEEAKSAGLSGFPFGVAIEPDVSLNPGVTQNYLLSIVDDVYIPPYEAGYAWQDGVLVGVRGRASRELDIAMTIEVMSQDASVIARTGRLDLLTTSNPPSVTDPSPYLEDARAFLSRDFTLIGYDPFENSYLPWATPLEERTRWLAAGSSGLVIREGAFDSFLNAVNDLLMEGDEPRYLDRRETIERLNRSLRSREDSVYLRVRYLPTTYRIQSGDRGFSIGRKTGLPFGLIDNANPGLNWNVLSVGQEITLPSRDLLLLEDPVPNKRIIVDLDNLWLVAYEDGEIVFSWPISSGRNDAPTYPGIFQILQKSDVAYGSSFSLCNSQGNDCGQWTMYWFMGIYEVIPGLMNGFHGAVLLPNGGFLGGGGVRGRTTYGCIMSENSEAERLYAWADIGTVVEIISNDFAPRSDLGIHALEYILETAY